MEYPDGTEVNELASGQTQTAYADGKKVTVVPGDQTHVEYPGELGHRGIRSFAEYNAGHTLMKFTNGRKVAVFSDQHRTTYPDGTEVTDFASGQMQTKHRDGTEETIFEDGKKQTTFPDGKRVTGKISPPFITAMMQSLR